MALEILIVLCLTLLNGVFAGAEIAVLSVRRTRLAELEERGAWGARAVAWLRSQPERFLATVQVGITVITTTAAAFGGETLAEDATRALARIEGFRPYAHSVGFTAVVLGISFVSIVLGELVPKSLALRTSERYALLLAPPLRALATALKPAVWLLTATSNLVLRLFGDRTSFTEARMSADEIQDLVEEAARAGSLDASTGDLASRALDFPELAAADVMVPRTRMVCVPLAATREELHDVYTGHRYARMPVYDGAPDNVVGYLAIRDLVGAALAREPLSVKALMRPVRFVPETARADQLLRTMQSERAPMAIVVDERGDVTGLVTVEDLVEELVGEILSEHDTAPPAVAREPDGSVVLPAATPIRDASRLLDHDLPERPGVGTVAGLCLHAAGRIPPPGAVLKLEDGTVLEVIDASPRRVRRVRIRPAPREGD